MKRSEIEIYKKKAIEIYKNAGIVLSDEEKANVEVADFGLNDIENTGLEIVTYVNTQRVCSKELAMTPHQTCPEHRHPKLTEKNYIGKEETFRCRYGEVYLYVPGDMTKNPSAKAPAGDEEWYTVWNEVKLLPGEQYTLAPNTLHWFQAGKDGAIVSEFSTPSYDEADIFTNPNIARIPEIED